MDRKRIMEVIRHWSRDERAALASEIIQTLDDDPPDPDAEKLWGEEIRRRLDEVDSGSVKTVPWPEVRRRMHAVVGHDPDD